VTPYQNNDVILILVTVKISTKKLLCHQKEVTLSSEHIAVSKLPRGPK